VFDGIVRGYQAMDPGGGLGAVIIEVDPEAVIKLGRRVQELGAAKRLDGIESPRAVAVIGERWVCSDVAEALRDRRVRVNLDAQGVPTFESLPEGYTVTSWWRGRRRAVTLEVGREYTVDPLSSHRSRGRRCELLGLVTTSDGKGQRAKVRYLDNRRVGQVDPGNLAEADLSEADLSGAHLRGATMPDGTIHP